jgi:pyridinium-3,5-biscarboxylic acid mononucleotide synthase
VVTTATMGNDIERRGDVGIADLHRQLANRESAHAGSVVIVYSEMEDRLPSIVGA